MPCAVSQAFLSKSSAQCHKQFNIQQLCTECMDTFCLTNKISRKIRLPLTMEVKNQFKELQFWLLLNRLVMAFLRLQGLCWFCFAVRLATCHPTQAHSSYRQGRLPWHQLCQEGISCGILTLAHDIYHGPKSSLILLLILLLPLPPSALSPNLPPHLTLQKEGRT